MSTELPKKTTTTIAVNKRKPEDILSDIKSVIDELKVPAVSTNVLEKKMADR
jgi:hypothetical protein